MLPQSGLRGRLPQRSSLSKRSQKRDSNPFILKLAFLSAVALTLVLLIRLALRFFAQPESDLISWDQAARANEAVLLAKEIHFSQFAKFIGHMFSLNWWPPLHHLIMLLFILSFGPGFKAIIFPSFAAYSFSVFSILFTFKNLSPGNDEDRLLDYSLLFSLAITSPLLLSSATWAMLEIFGVSLSYLAFGLYFRATITNSSKTMRICGITGFLLWTLKYNYGLLFSIVVFLAELARAEQFRPKLLLSRQKFRLLSSPLFYPAYLLFGLIIYISVTGGRSFELLDIRISLTNIYNPAMYLYQYLFLIMLFLIKKEWPQIKDRLRPGQKELIIWGALPAGIFLFFPDKIKAIIMNLEAVQKNKLSIYFDNIFFYLRSVGIDYSVFWLLNVFTFIMLCVALANWRKTPVNLRLMMTFFLVGFLATSLGFGLRESRYIATFVPALWIVTAWSSGFVMKRAPIQLKNALALFISISTAIAIVHLPVLIDKAIKQPWAPWAHHGIAYRALLKPVIERTQSAQKVLILGASDLGFVPLLSWKLQMTQFENPYFLMDIDPPQDVHMSGHIFLERMMLKHYDLVILFIVDRGIYERPIRGWSRALKKSGRYHLSRKESFRTPKPCKILFFAHIKTGLES
jgi:hypothetical protein